MGEYLLRKNKYGNYKRVLTIEKLRERFENHHKLHDFEVERLFGKRKYSNIQLRYLEKGIRYQGIYDIETSDFNPLGRFIICYVFYRRDIVTGKIEKFEDCITKRDISAGVKRNRFDFDYRLLQTLAKRINSVQQIVGHYSSKFDTPYFRTRCLLTNQPELIPTYGKVMQADTWRMMKNTLKAPRNTLQNLALYTNTPDQKTHVAMKRWVSICFKDSPEWYKDRNYILKHCRYDVNMTLKALKKIEKFNPVSLVRT